MKKMFIREFKTSLILGIKIGILAAFIGVIFHLIWGNLDEIKYTAINSFVIGYLIGFIEPSLSYSRIARLPYSVLLLFRIIIYFIITIISIYTFLLIYLKSIGLQSNSLSDPQIFEEISKVYFLANINTISILILILIISFLWQLKAFFVKGVIFNYMIGKYHKPTCEDRIFMFLDLNDATTLAEKLGNEKYSLLISDFFNDLDLAITKTEGHIYQYVGDEVVIIWKLKNGLKNNNCLNAFILAKEIFENKKILLK